MTSLFKKSLIGAVLAGTTALPALAAEISWIYCGDKIDPVHEKAIADWDARNPDFRIAVEVAAGNSARTRPRRWPRPARPPGSPMSGRAR